MTAETAQIKEMRTSRGFSVQEAIPILKVKSPEDEESSPELVECFVLYISGSSTTVFAGSGKSTGSDPVVDIDPSLLPKFPDWRPKE